jgi:hypothetical protein
LHVLTVITRLTTPNCTFRLQPSDSQHRIARFDCNHHTHSTELLVLDVICQTHNTELHVLTAIITPTAPNCTFSLQPSDSQHRTMARSGCNHPTHHRITRFDCNHQTHHTKSHFSTATVTLRHNTEVHLLDVIVTLKTPITC